MIAASTLSNELRLVAACCRWPRGGERDSAVRAAAARPIDWGRFERVLRRHRVYAQVHDGLTGAGVVLPEATGRDIAATAERARMSALALAREAALLQEAFDAAGCPALFVKGASLAMLAYGDPGFKWSWDIDLLTTAEGAVQARALIEQRGYVLVEPAALDARQFELFLRLDKECVFIHPETQVAVELHWQLVDNPHLLPGIGASSPAQVVRLGGKTLRTLEDDALLAYLLVHGTRHGWARLKWLADVGALLSRQAPDAIEPLYRRLRALGAGRGAGVGLLLCQDLFGIALADALSAELHADRATRHLVNTALAALGYGQGEGEVVPYTMPSIRILFSHWIAAPGWRPFLAELHAQWIYPPDWLALQLPRRLWFLHYLLRIPLWAVRRVGDLWHAVRNRATRSAAG